MVEKPGYTSNENIIDAIIAGRTLCKQMGVKDLAVFDAITESLGLSNWVPGGGAGYDITAGYRDIYERHILGKQKGDLRLNRENRRKLIKERTVAT